MDRYCPVCQDSCNVQTTDLEDGCFLSVCDSCGWRTGCDDSVDLCNPDANGWVLEPYEDGPCLNRRDHCPLCIGFNKVGLMVSQCRICGKQGILHYNSNDMNSETLDNVLFGAINKMLGVDPKDPEFLETPSISEMATEEDCEHDDTVALIANASHHPLVDFDIDIVCDCGNNLKEFYEVIVDSFGEPTLLRCFQCSTLFCCDTENSCASYIVCEKCGNSNEDIFRKIYGNCRDLVGVQCLNCSAEVRFGKVSERKNFSDCTYIHKARISSWDQVERGNHISWQRAFSYEHHAIVVSVDPNNNCLCVIEYGSNCDSIGLRLSLACVQIREEKIESLNDVFLYRYDYDPENCFQPNEVVERAKDRIGERSYNVLLKNCEHFATWCKTGKEFCSQIIPMTKRALHTVIAFLNQLTKPVIDLIRQEFFQVIVAGASVDDVIGLAADKLSLLKYDRAFNIGRIGGTILLNLLVELAMFCYNYSQIKKDLEKGKIDKTEFRKQVFQLGGESIGGLLLGLLLGFSWILLGPGLLATVVTLVLNILGIIGGRFLGAWLGRKVHKLTSAE